MSRVNGTMPMGERFVVHLSPTACDKLKDCMDKYPGHTDEAVLQAAIVAGLNWFLVDPYGKARFKRARLTR